MISCGRSPVRIAPSCPPGTACTTAGDDRLRQVPGDRYHPAAGAPVNSPGVAG
jgi:hypothetical protein